MCPVRSRLSRSSIVALLILLALGVRSTQGAEPAAVVYEESFAAYADGEHPSSIVEIERTPRRYGEVVGGRYAVNAGGNSHLLVAPG